MVSGNEEYIAPTWYAGGTGIETEISTDRLCIVTKFNHVLSASLFSE